MVSIAFILIFNRKRCAQGAKSFGGAERRLLSIFSSLENQKIKHRSLIVGVNEKQPIAIELARYVSSYEEVLYFENKVGFVKHLIAERYDAIIYADAAIKSFVLGMLGTLLGCRKLLLSVTHTRARREYSSPIERLIMDLSFRASSAIDTLYPSSVGILKGKFPKKSISVTPPSLPRMHVFQSGAEKKNRILFASRLVADKNPKVLIQAIVLIKDKLRKYGYQCLICGDGYLKEDLRTQICNQGIEDIVKLCGYMNMENLTPITRIFLSLQTRENYPSQSLLEAIAAGCYCIATNVGDTAVIIKSDFGTLVPLTEIAIAHAISNAIDFEDEKWRCIENAAKAFANKVFCFAKVKTHYEEMILKLK